MRRRNCTHKPEIRKMRRLGDWALPIVGEENMMVPDDMDWWLTTTCEYGNCVELLCPICRRYFGGWGPIDCPCDDWIPHKGMRRQKKVARKPSDHRRPTKRTAGRRR